MFAWELCTETSRTKAFCSENCISIFIKRQFQSAHCHNQSPEADHEQALFSFFDPVCCSPGQRQKGSLAIQDLVSHSCFNLSNACPNLSTCPGKSWRTCPLPRGMPVRLLVDMMPRRARFRFRCPGNIPTLTSISVADPSWMRSADHFCSTFAHLNAENLAEKHHDCWTLLRWKMFSKWSYW